jgi:hypothetical protein
VAAVGKRKLILRRKKRPVYVYRIGTQYLLLPPELKDIPGSQRVNPFPTKGALRKSMDRLVDAGKNRRLARHINACPKTANPPALTGNFTLRTIIKSVPRELAADRFSALQRSGQYSELRLIQRGKAFYDIVGYKWPDKGVRRKLGIGRARQNPSLSAGVTPNQVKFGMRGRTKVGWINYETPTRYYIFYKVGDKIKHVWRDKDMVTFVGTGRRGKLNPCPTKANPSEEYKDHVYPPSAVAGGKKGWAVALPDGKTHKSGFINQKQAEAFAKLVWSPSPVERAAGLSKKFHGAAPRVVKHIDFRPPQCLALIGSCAQLDYVSDKWDGKKRQYYHKFEKPCLVMADPDPQPDGSRMIVLLGKFRINERGIIG